MWPIPESEEDSILWEGNLEPSGDAAVRALRQTPGAGQLDDKQTEAEIANLPEITIRVPRVWNVRDIAPNDQLRPREASDYYLVRLVCSLRPHRDRQSIDWAEFTTTLSSSGSGIAPIAFDLHPSRETQTIRRNVALSLAPEIKFHEVGVSPGEIQVGFQYDELAPTITTYGIQSPEPAWEYSMQKGVRLQGDKIMHLLIQAPQGTPDCTASFELRADVRIGRFPVLPTRLFPRRTSVDAEPLSYRLW
jgi:hypothetical protein